MVVTKREALNHEEHGAIMKVKCGKDSSIVPSLFFSLFLFGLLDLFFYFLFFSIFCLLFGLFGLFFLFPHMGQCSHNDDHHSFIYSQLKAQNDDDSIGNASDSVPGCATI